jgi:hypothetical protein
MKSLNRKNREMIISILIIVISAPFGVEITKHNAICALLFVIFTLNGVEITTLGVKITPPKKYHQYNPLAYIPQTI